MMRMVKLSKGVLFYVDDNRELWPMDIANLAWTRFDVLLLLLLFANRYFMSIEVLFRVEEMISQSCVVSCMLKLTTP